METLTKETFYYRFNTDVEDCLDPFEDQFGFYGEITENDIRYSIFIDRRNLNEVIISDNN